MISPELAAWRQKVAAQTEADRKREVAGGTKTISAVGRRTLEYLIHGSSPQQQGDSAA